jgi:hypothetical protein
MGLGVRVKLFNFTLTLTNPIDKCAPQKTFKLTGTQGSSALEQTNIVLPLYYAMYLPQKL